MKKNTDWNLLDHLPNIRTNGNNLVFKVNNSGWDYRKFQGKGVWRGAQ